MTDRSAAPQPEARTGVEFVHAGDRYALPLEHVVEVLPLDADSLRAGRLAYRGSDLPIVDAGDVLGLPAAHTPRRALVVRVEGHQVALAVEQVREVSSYHDGRRHDPPEYFAPRTRALTASLLEDDAGLVVLLDFERLAAELARGAAGE